MEKKVIYNGQIITLTRFWATNEMCLWINNPEQINIPKMEFVGGYPDEYCVFIKNLSEEEIAQITLLDGSQIDIEKEMDYIG